jgi:hypothetical protein
MRPCTFVAAFAGASLTAAILSTAVASPVIFTFAGTLERAENFALISDTPFFTGSPITGGFTIETDASGASTVAFGDGTEGRKLPAGNASVQSEYRSGSGGSGNVSFSLPCLTLEGCGSFHYEVVLSFPTAADLTENLSLELLAENGWSAAAAFRDGSLAGFSVRRFVWTIPVNAQTNAVLEGTVETLQRVPAPGTLALLGFGVAAIAAIKRKKLAA